MATEFLVTLPDTPGSLARFGRALGDARVNIEAIMGIAGEGEGRVRFVPDSPPNARLALEAGAFHYGVDDLLGAIQVAGGMAVMIGQ